MKRFIKSTIVLFLAFSACQNKAGAQAFTRIDSLVGLDIVRNNNAVSVADYDLDGDLDIFFTGYYSFDPNDEGTWNRLMRNNGDGTFGDVTMEAGFTNQYINTDITASLGEKLGASWGDYDNDGYPDLYLANSREDQLYHNEGDGTFKDVTEEAGVFSCRTCYSSSGVWFDHNRDGYLDLYISILNGRNYLYQNMGDGTFRDATLRYDVGGIGVTWTTLALDIGKDGYLDLYCANDTQINEFFENRSGTHYNESSRAYRVADEGAGMGMTVGDYNNDGFFDIYVTNIYNHQPNPLFKNLGNRRFENVAEELGVDNTGWGWGTHFFDYDLDGDEDLAAVNGVVSKQYIEGEEQVDVQNFFFKNTLIENGVPGFVDWSVESGTDGEDRARGLEVFDYDGDGDLDMLVANVVSSPYFFKNNTIEEKGAGGKNWLQIKLEGTRSNRNAFGTEVKISFGDQSLYRWYHGAGFFGQSIKPVHFGVGEAEMIDEIQVTWLSGEVETFYDVPVNQTIKIKESSGLTDTEDVLAKNQLLSDIQAYPNPFTEAANITFEAQQAGTMSFSVFSSVGQEVYRTAPSRIGPSRQIIRWDGTENSDMNAQAGMYFYVIHFEGRNYHGKLIKH